MNITPEVVEALRVLRLHIADSGLERNFNVLDNAGVFREVDEHTDYGIEPIFCDRLPFPRMCSRLHRHAGECK